MEYFFAQLFAGSPDIRALFPLGMAQTRAAVFDGLARLMWMVDCPREFEASLRRIARGHRKYGVRGKHYPLFFDALLTTVQLVSGARWTPATAQAWLSLAAYMTKIISDELAADEARLPAWWVGEIVRHDRRSATVAVLTIRPDWPLGYLPGQYVSVQVPRWPRVWRSYSIANAPRHNGLIDLHVRAVPGGTISTFLVSQAAPADQVIIGPPEGPMRPPANRDAELVCVAAGTGLAPLKAIIEDVAGEPWQRRRRISLYLGGRDDHDFYDIRDLLTLQSACPGLRIVPAVATSYRGRPPGAAPLMQAVSAHPDLRAAEVYLSGPARMVSDLARLLEARVKPSSLHHDRLDVLLAACGQPPAGQPPAR